MVDPSRTRRELHPVSRPHSDFFQRVASEKERTPLSPFRHGPVGISPSLQSSSFFGPRQTPSRPVRIRRNEISRLPILDHRRFRRNGSLHVEEDRSLWIPAERPHRNLRNHIHGPLHHQWIHRTADSSVRVDHQIYTPRYRLCLGGFSHREGSFRSLFNATVRRPLLTGKAISS
jgi:hypothetical protein